MSHGARSLYVALKVRYNTRLQNSVYMSARHGAEELVRARISSPAGITSCNTTGLSESSRARKPAWIRWRRDGGSRSPYRTLLRWPSANARLRALGRHQIPLSEEKQKQNPSYKLGTPRPAKWGHLSWLKRSTASKSVPQTGDIGKALEPVPQTGDITRGGGVVSSRGVFLRGWCVGSFGGGRGVWVVWWGVWGLGVELIGGCPFRRFSGASEALWGVVEGLGGGVALGSGGGWWVGPLVSDRRWVLTTPSVLPSGLGGTQAMD